MLYAPACFPQTVTNMVEAALTCHNHSNYRMAVATYKKGWAACRDWIEGGGENQPSGTGLPSTMSKKAIEELELIVPCFFQNAIGNVYESEGLDEMALGCYLDARKYVILE
jgi:hypothetical protein